MCVFFLVVMIGLSVGLCLLAKYLVASKTIQLPLEREAYVRFNRKMYWMVIPLVAALFFLPVIFIQMQRGQRSFCASDLWWLGLGIGALFGLSSFLFVCPNCGKFLSLPIKGARDALYHLSVGECPECNFNLHPKS